MGLFVKGTVIQAQIIRVTQDRTSEEFKTSTDFIKWLNEVIIQKQR